MDGKVVGVKNVKNNINMEIEAQDAEFEKLYECPEGCGRSFRRQALEKHVKICKQVFQKDGKDGRGASVAAKTKEEAKERSSSTNNQKWKKDSENFRKLMKKGATGVEGYEPVVLVKEKKQ